MQVITKSFPGLIVCCSGCGALLKYGPADIYYDSIYCPLCKKPTQVPLIKDYDGVIKNPEKLEENAKKN